jgi:hypothetical protein
MCMLGDMEEKLSFVIGVLITGEHSCEFHKYINILIKNKHTMFYVHRWYVL